MTATISLRVTMSALLPFFFFCLVEFSSRSSAIPVAPSPIDNIAPMGSDSGPYSSTRHPDVALWANAAFAYIQNLNCKEVLYMPLPSCMKLQATKSSGIAVHVAMPNPLGKYKASFLNGERLSHSSRHDAVLALDPHPEKRSRHLIMLFFVDEDVDSTICEIKNGVTLANGECLTPALKRGCHNLMNQFPSARRKYSRRCETKHLPVVHLERSFEDHLNCSDHLDGAAPCQDSGAGGDGIDSNSASGNRWSASDEEGDECDPLKTNRRCPRSRPSEAASHESRDADA